jgi:hypothetical protein
MCKMSDLPLQREAEAVARSRSLRRFRNAVVVGTNIFLIVVGFVVSALTAYEMGYVHAKSSMSATPREIARFHLLGKSEVMGIFSGAAITLIGIVTLFRVLRGTRQACDKAKGVILLASCPQNESNTLMIGKIGSRY